MEAMQGQPVEEWMHAAGSVQGTRKAVMDWYHDWYRPTGDAETDHLKKDFENIAIQGDEDPQVAIRPCRKEA